MDPPPLLNLAISNRKEDNTLQKNAIRSFFAIGAVCAVLAFAPASQAALISTSSCAATNVPPDGSALCSGLGSAVGYDNLKVEFRYAVDVTYDPFNPPGSATFALNAPLVPWDIVGLIVTDVTRPVSGSTGQIAISAVDFSGNFQANFNVAVSAVFAGTGTNGNANMEFRLYGDRIPDQGVPEPTTLAMIGGALMLAGLVRRKVA